MCYSLGGGGLGGGILSPFCVKPRSVNESWHVRVESVEWVCLFTMFRACDLPRWVFSKALLWFWESLRVLLSVAKGSWVERVGMLCVGRKRGMDGMGAAS